MKTAKFVNTKHHSAAIKPMAIAYGVALAILITHLPRHTSSCWLIKYLLIS